MKIVTESDGTNRVISGSELGAPDLAAVILVLRAKEDVERPVFALVHCVLSPVLATYRLQPVRRTGHRPSSVQAQGATCCYASTRRPALRARVLGVHRRLP